MYLFCQKHFDIVCSFLYDIKAVNIPVLPISREVMSVSVAETHLLPDHYTPVGDLTVVAVCLVMLALIAFSYVRRSASFRVFLFIIPCLILAAVLDVVYNRLAVTLGAVPVVYALRCLFHAALFTVYFLFILYIIEVTSLDRKRTNITLTAAAVVLFSVIGVDVFTSIRSLAGAGASRGLNAGGQIVVLVGYLLFTAANVSLLASVRHRLYRRVMMGFYASMAVSFAVLILQRAFGGGSSFTVASFLFPVIAMLYIMHSHPYDAETGTIGWEALADVVRYNYQKQKPFLFLSAFFPEFSGEGSKMPETLRALVRRFPADHFRGALIFQLDNGHLLLLARRDRNPDYERRIGRFRSGFCGACSQHAEHGAAEHTDAFFHDGSSMKSDWL